MNRNIWDEQYGVPNQKYLGFVAYYLLQQETDLPLVDPFARDMTVDKAKEIYVPREGVEKQIGQPDTQVIIGAEGSGKTTLLRTLFTSQEKTLIVQLPLGQIATSIPELEWTEGETSLLSPHLLVRYVFNAYWEDLLRRPLNRARFLPELRHDEQWVARLQWFYQHYRPVDAEIVSEAELVRRLDASTPILSLESPPDGMLKVLVHFVTSTASRQERATSFTLRPYAQILVLIDGTRYLPERAVGRLVKDMQRYRNMCSGNLQFKLFTDLNWQGLIQSTDGAVLSQVKVYNLPRWTTEELRRILSVRLTALKKGEFAGYGWGDLMEYDWGDSIPDNHLELAAKKRLVDIIIQAATRTYEVGSHLEAPVHALRLARGLLAACAGCWEGQGYKPPLAYREIKELADLYWEAKTTTPVIRIGPEEKAWARKKLAYEPRPPERLPKVKAVVRVRDHEPDSPFYVGKKFVLEAGVRMDILESLESVESPSSVLERELQFKIVIYAEDMEILPTRMKPYVLRPGEHSPLAEFELKPMQPGRKQVKAEFIHQQSWLAEIEFDVTVVQVLESILSTNTVENC